MPLGQFPDPPGQQIVGYMVALNACRELVGVRSFTITEAPWSRECRESRLFGNPSSASFLLSGLRLAAGEAR